MPESPSKLPDDLPSPSTANPQENERVPHIQDFLATRHGWFPVSGLHLAGSVRSNGPNTWSRIEIAFLWDWAENVAETVCSGPVLGLLLHGVAVLEGEVPAPWPQGLTLSL